MKIQKYTFCMEFNWGHIREFYDDDVIAVTLLVLRTQSISALFCPAVCFYNSPCVKQRCSWREKWTSSTSKRV